MPRYAEGRIIYGALVAEDLNEQDVYIDMCQCLIDFANKDERKGRLVMGYGCGDRMVTGPAGCIDKLLSRLKHKYDIQVDWENLEIKVGSRIKE